ncbi:MAG: hypothetical protein IPM18_04365 [Phycisphaerales bacterium]|nr:hypothetical protein [Phycisphaerales bacterium]
MNRVTGFAIRRRTRRALRAAWPRWSAALVLLMGCTTAMPNDERTDKLVRDVLRDLASDSTYATAEVLRMQREPGFVAALLAAVPDAPAAARRPLVELAVELGRPRIPPAGDLPEYLAPYVADPRIVGFLVGELSAEDPEVRSRAGELLAVEVPDPLIRDYLPDVLAHLQRYPEIDGAAWLLGRTGAQRARELLESNAALRDANPAATQAALAKLGDVQAEDALLAAYRNAKEPRDKAEAALRLGYAGTVRCVLALARDIRTPETYVWMRLSRRSLRVHIIEGLHAAFPTEPLFWRPLLRPRGDEFYERIEQWITARLGVTWEQPRPPFLYEEDAPHPVEPD